MKYWLSSVILMAVALMGCSSDDPEINLDDVVVNMTTAGQLSNELGSHANEITKLTVHGSINDDDFHTMWSASLYGQLSVIDLSGAVIEGNAIPGGAFYNLVIQGHPGYILINCPPASHILRSKLEQIILPEGISAIGSFAFANTRLTRLTIPSTVETIGSYAFADCTCLASVSLPTQIKHIGTFGFYRCSSLRELYLPSSLESLDPESLNIMFPCVTIYSASKNPPVYKATYYVDTPFGHYDNNTVVCDSRILSSMPVYVPAGSAELYRNATGWDYFQNFIELDPFPTAADVKY